MSGSTSKTITVYNANLFAIAAQYYNDATLWWLIASNNGLSDPQIISSSPITLIIPPYDANYVGGIPQ